MVPPPAEGRRRRVGAATRRGDNGGSTRRHHRRTSWSCSRHTGACSNPYDQSSRGRRCTQHVGRLWTTAVEVDGEPRRRAQRRQRARRRGNDELLAGEPPSQRPQHHDHDNTAITTTPRSPQHPDHHNTPITTTPRSRRHQGYDDSATGQMTSSRTAHSSGWFNAKTTASATCRGSTKMHLRAGTVLLVAAIEERRTHARARGASRRPATRR
jgi:hypothetical protein